MNKWRKGEEGYFLLETLLLGFFLIIATLPLYMSKMNETMLVHSKNETAAIFLAQEMMAISEGELQKEKSTSYTQIEELNGVNFTLKSECIEGIIKVAVQWQEEGQDKEVTLEKQLQ